MLGQIEGHESEEGRLMIGRGFTFFPKDTMEDTVVCVFRDLPIFLYAYVIAIMHV